MSEAKLAWKLLIEAVGELGSTQLKVEMYIFHLMPYTGVQFDSKI